jgi:hypothetical protein
MNGDHIRAPAIGGAWDKYVIEGDPPIIETHVPEPIPYGAPKRGDVPLSEMRIRRETYRLERVRSKRSDGAIDEWTFWVLLSLHTDDAMKMIMEGYARWQRE